MAWSETYAALMIAEMQLKGYAIKKYPKEWGEYKLKAGGNVEKAWELWQVDMSEVFGIKNG